MKYLAADHIKNKFGVDFNFGGNWSTLHSHEFWEFILVIDSCVHIINNKKIPVLKSNALIIRPSDNHMFVSAASNISQFNIKIRDDLFRQFVHCFDDEIYQKLTSDDEPITLKLNDIEYTNINKNCLSALSAKNDKIYSLYLKSSIETIFLKFISEKVLNKTYNYSLLVQEIMERLSALNNLSRPLTELLSGLGFSYMQLYRIFKRETGFSMSDFFFNTKMEYASFLLKSSPKTICEISQTLGYSTQSHFSKIFKEYFGCSPQTYRKNEELLLPAKPKFVYKY